MFKKIIAMTTATVILLTPIQASAATWGDIVNALKTSNTFSDGSTNATRNNDGDYTISGGTIEDIVSVGDMLFSGTLKVLFQNIKMSQMNVDANSGNTISIILDVGSKITQSVEAMASGENTKLSLVNMGEIHSLNATTEDQAQTTIENSLEISEVESHVDGKGSETEFVNEKDGRVSRMFVTAQNGGQGSATNEGKFGQMTGRAESGSQISMSNNGLISGAGGAATGKDSEYEFTNEKDGEIEYLYIDSVNGGKVNASNSGTVTDEVSNYVSGKGSEFTFTNEKTGEINYLGNDSRDGGQMTSQNSGTITSASNYAKDKDSEVSFTNNKDGKIDHLSNNSNEGGKASTTNSGTITEVGSHAFGKDSETSFTNNKDGKIDNLYNSSENGGKANASNNGTITEVDSWTNGKDSETSFSNEKDGKIDQFYSSSDEGGKISTSNSGTINTANNFASGKNSETEFINEKDGYVGMIGADTWDEGATVNANNKGNADMATIWVTDGSNIILKNDGKIGNGENVSMYSFVEGSGNLMVTGGGSIEPYTITMEDGSQHTVSMIAQFDGNLSADEIKQKVSEIAKFENSGDYLVLTISWDENGNDVYHYLPIHVAAEPAYEVPLADQIRHEMEEKRQAEAIGGVYGSPYWIKQMYLGYHSYNLRLYIGEERVLMRESLSWNADGSKSICFRVRQKNPEKLTMRFDERALEVFERTNITVITLLDGNSNGMMQYRVADLRAAYDGFGLHDTEQLVVGGVEDEVMKIGADGQMVSVE